MGINYVIKKTTFFPFYHNKNYRLFGDIADDCLQLEFDFLDRYMRKLVQYFFYLVKILEGMDI